MSDGQGLLRRPVQGTTSSPGPQLSPMGEGGWKGCPTWDSASGGPLGRCRWWLCWAGAERHGHPRHTEMSACVGSAGRGITRMGSSCQPPQPEVGVALDKAQGTRRCGFLSLSSLSSSTHLSPSIFHKSFFPILPEQLGEHRWGDHQGARCSAAQLDEKGSARCTSSSHCQHQMLWPQPGLPSARGAFQVLSSPAQVIKPNPFPWMRQA